MSWPAQPSTRLLCSSDMMKSMFLGCIALPERPLQAFEDRGGLAVSPQWTDCSSNYSHEDINGPSPARDIPGHGGAAQPQPCRRSARYHPAGALQEPAAAAERTWHQIVPAPWP